MNNTKVVSRKPVSEPVNKVGNSLHNKGKLITLQEASNIFKYKVSYLRKLIAKGVLTSYQIGEGCKIFVDQEEVDQMIRHRHR